MLDSAGNINFADNIKSEQFHFSGPISKGKMIPLVLV